MPITAEAAGRDLPELVRQVVARQLPIEISSEQGEAILLSLADYEGLVDLALRLRAPEAADVLVDGLAEAQRLDRQAPERA